VFRRDLAPDGDQKPDFYVLNGIVNGHLARHRDLRGLPGIVIINDTILPRPAFRALAAALPATLTRIYQTPSVKRYYSGSDVCSFADHDVMPAGVDLRVFRRDAVRDFQAVTNRGTVQLGSLCNISARKGVDDAIEATYLVARRMPAFDFVYTVTGQRLATQHDYTQRLVELAGTSPSNCKVEFAAPVDQAGAASFLRSLDLLLVASKSESFPQSVIQAQAVGTPVIGYDIPGVNDQIMDGETGFLVAPGDVEQLAGRIYDAIKAPAELEAVAAAARRRVEAEFTLERNVKDFIAISERASAHHPTGAAVQAGSG
jgi:glycosyltransferase involved in cell wall biosynthesis